MRIVAIETSGPVGSVCLAEDGRALAEERFHGAREHGRLLAPSLDVLFERLGWDRRRDVHRIAVSQGPGSYTGLRVGAAFAKGLAYATGAPLVGVPSLDVLAQNALDDEGFRSAQGHAAHVCVVVDAKRGQVYAARYLRRGGLMVREGDLSLESPAEWVARLPRPVLVLGDGLAHHAAAFAGEGIRAAPASLWVARAAKVARLAWERRGEGLEKDPAAFSPIYMRPSEAEEKRLRALEASR